MFYISLWASKLYDFFTRNVKSDRVGLLSLYIDNMFLKHISKPKIVIAVTGTNGKTTTCNFLKDILQSKYKVIGNSEGNNLRAGIAKALMRGVNIFNKCKADVAIIEFDELSSDIILPYIKPTYTVVTNLSQDTMSRNGHTDFVFNKITDGITDDTILVLNADDLISSNLKGNKKIYFGMNKLEGDDTKSNSILQDVRVCPNCLTKLEYDYIKYHHIGKAHCPKCGFTNFEADYKLLSVDYSNKTINVNGKNYPLINDSIFNMYNELAAITISDLLEVKDIDKVINNIKIVESRYLNEVVNGVEIISQFAKGQSPIAVSQALKYIVSQKGTKDIILILDDQHETIEHHDSEITSWMYDADFEYLKDKKINKIIIGGNRCYDYKVRLLLAGIDSSKIEVEYDELKTHNYLSKKTDKVIVIHDLYNISLSNELVEKIKEVLD